MGKDVPYLMGGGAAGPVGSLAAEHQGRDRHHGGVIIITITIITIILHPWISGSEGGGTGCRGPADRE